MRVSTNRNDEGYNEDAFSYDPIINGELIKNCVTADTETGFYTLVYPLSNRIGNFYYRSFFGDVKLMKVER